MRDELRRALPSRPCRTCLPLLSLCRLENIVESCRKISHISMVGELLEVVGGENLTDICAEPYEFHMEMSGERVFRGPAMSLCAFYSLFITIYRHSTCGHVCLWMSVLCDIKSAHLSCSTWRRN